MMVPEPMSVALTCQMADDTWEDFHFASEKEAGAFVLAVHTYHQTGMGEDWYADIFQISRVVREFAYSSN